MGYKDFYSRNEHSVEYALRIITLERKRRGWMLNRVIQQFKLNVLSINEVEDSHSSTVYKCKLLNGENFF